MKIWELSNEEIGAKLKKAREELKFNVLDCAHHAGCSIPTIHAYESGKGKSVPLSYVLFLMSRTSWTLERLLK